MATTTETLTKTANDLASQTGLSFDQDLLIQYAITYGTKIIGAFAIFILGKWISKTIVKALRRLMERAKLEATLVSFAANMAYGIMLAFVVIAAISHLGVETTSLAAVIGAAGLAVGLALQGSLSNFAAGVMIILFRPFKLDDVVEMTGVIGTVKDISIFTTTLITGDNKTVIIPNASVTSGNITNFSTQGTRRVDLVFGCGYDDNIKQVKETLEEIVAQDSRILKDPAPRVALQELADSSVNFVVRPWVNSVDYWDVYFDLHEQVKLTFDEKGISIPFPQQDVHIQHMPATDNKDAKAA